MALAEPRHLGSASVADIFGNSLLTGTTGSSVKISDELLDSFHEQPLHTNIDIDESRLNDSDEGEI